MLKKRLNVMCFVACALVATTQLANAQGGRTQTTGTRANEAQTAQGDSSRTPVRTGTTSAPAPQRFSAARLSGDLAQNMSTMFSSVVSGGGASARAFMTKVFGANQALAANLIDQDGITSRGEAALQLAIKRNEASGDLSPELQRCLTQGCSGDSAFSAQASQLERVLTSSQRNSIGGLIPAWDLQRALYVLSQVQRECGG